MSQIHGANMGSPAAIVDAGGRLYVNTIIDGAKVRGSGLVMFPKSEDRLLNERMFSCGHVFKNIIADGSVSVFYDIGSLDLHLDWVARADGNVDIELFENVHVSNSGTSCNTFNLNRCSTETLNSTAYFNPTITDSGTLLIERYLLGGSGDDWRTSTESLATSKYDILLCTGSTYWIKMINDAGRTTNISYKGIVHEHKS